MTEARRIVARKEEAWAEFEVPRSDTSCHPSEHVRIISGYHYALANKNMIYQI